MSRPYWLALAILGAGIALTTGSAIAQDRVVPGPGSKAVPRALGGFTCREPTLNVLRAQNTAALTRSTSFRTLFGTEVSFQTPGPRCVKVTFSGTAACRQIAADDIPGRCLVRARVNDSAMHPVGDRTFITEDHPTAGHALEWIARVESGVHTVSIQFRVSDTDTLFEIGSWTMSLAVLMPW